MVDVGVDDDDGQPFHKANQLLDLGVGHTDSLITEKLSGLLDSQHHAFRRKRQFCHELGLTVARGIARFWCSPERRFAENIRGCLCFAMAAKDS
jgi:hypothetical protein